MIVNVSATVIIASQRQDASSVEQGLTQEEMAAIDAGTTLEELAEMGLTLEELLARGAEIDAALGRGENFSVNARLAGHQLDTIREGFISASGSRIYSDFYGGSAIDSDGMAVIFIVESRLEEAYNHDVIGPLLKAGLRYRLVEFSFNELLRTSFEISGITGDRYTAYRCIYSSHVTFIFPDIFNNNVVVVLAGYNEQMIEGFRRYVFDSPMLTLRVGGQLGWGGGQGMRHIATMMWIGIIIAAIGIIIAIIGVICIIMKILFRLIRH